jgi:hypothetical protein
MHVGRYLEIATSSAAPEFEATIGLWFRHATVYNCNEKDGPYPGGLFVSPAPENRLFPIVTRAIRRVFEGDWGLQ